MKCWDCEHFLIRQEPVHANGLYDMGMAVCTKHNLVKDFSDRGVLKRLKCVEEENEDRERTGIRTGKSV